MINLLPYLPLVLKAVAGKNVKEEMDINPDIINRPFWLSGRFIGVVMTTLFGGFAAKIGMDLNASITNVTELANLIADNKELLIAVGGMVAGIARGVLGFFQRKKD